MESQRVVAALGDVVERVADQVGPSVVGIGRGGGRGSGFVVGEGRVLTNAHNLRGPEVTVRFGDGRLATGRVEGVDVDGDLAVVAVDTGAVSPVVWGGGTGGEEHEAHQAASGGSGGPVRPGGVVLALANPSGRVLRTTLGFVSAVDRAFRGPRGRRITGSIEHTAPLAPGSSGGPVVDVAGRVIGVNTHRLGEGFYLAVPADDDLRRRVDALARGETPARRSLGVGVAPSEVARRLRRSVGLPERDGLLVRTLDDDGPAARAGMRVGDLLVAAGDRVLADVDDLVQVLDTASDRLVLRVVRGAEELDVAVSFGPSGGDTGAEVRDEGSG